MAEVGISVHSTLYGGPTPWRMRYDEPRNPEGANQRVASDSEIVAVMEMNEPNSASEIAELLGPPHSTAHRRPQQLQDPGTIRKKKHGHRSVTWMRLIGGDNG